MYDFYNEDHNPDWSVLESDTDTVEEGIGEGTAPVGVRSTGRQQEQQQEQQEQQRRVASCLARHQEDWNTYPCVPSYLLSNRLQQRMYAAIQHIVEHKCSAM